MDNNYNNGLDFDKLNQMSSKLEMDAINSILEDVPETIYELVNTNVLDYCLNNHKFGIKADVSARVLNNWVNQGVIIVDNEQKGKIKRFSRLENIWLNIVTDLRKFGFSLEKIKRIREQFFYQIKNYTYIKHRVLETILGTNNLLLVVETGGTLFIDEKLYNRLKKRVKPIYINVDFTRYIKEEFNDNSFNLDFDYIKDFEHLEKTKLLFFLKTNLFKELRITLSEGDVRLIQNSKELLNNQEITKSLQNWNFDKIQIIIDDEIETEILN